MTRLTAMLALCLAAPANAGTYDIQTIRDALFGVSKDHVFVLRSAQDNMASYFNETRTLALIAIDRTTGEETVWPVSSSYLETEPMDPMAPPLIVPAQLANAVDPFAKLAEDGGTLLLGQVGTATPMALHLAVASNGDVFTTAPLSPEGAALHDKVARSITPATYPGPLVASLARTTAVTGGSRDGSPAFGDPETAQNFMSATCHFERAWALTTPPDAAPSVLIASTCERPDEHSAHLIHLVLPDKR